MAKTQTEVINRALRVIGVLAEDIEPSTATREIAEEVLEGVLAEARSNAPITWNNDIPDAAFLALSNLVAADLAPMYPPAVGPNRARAWARLMAIVRPNDMRSVFPMETRLTLVEVGTNLYAANLESGVGEFAPVLPYVRQVSVNSALDTVRLITWNQNRIEDLDTINVDFAGYNEVVGLQWNGLNTDYRVTDAGLAAWLAGRADQSTWLTVRDPAAVEGAEGRSEYY